MRRAPRRPSRQPRRSDGAAVRPQPRQRTGEHHVHWHVVPLPPGVPFEEQQLAALDTDLGFDLSEEELEELAGRIRAALEAGG